MEHRIYVEKQGHTIIPIAPSSDYSCYLLASKLQHDTFTREVSYTVTAKHQNASCQHFIAMSRCSQWRHWHITSAFPSHAWPRDQVRLVDLRSDL